MPCASSAGPTTSTAGLDVSGRALALAHSAGVVEGLLRADRALRGEERIPLAPLDHLARQRHERAGWLSPGQLVTWRDEAGWHRDARYDGVRLDPDGRPELVLTPLPIRELAHYQRLIAQAHALGREPDDSWVERVGWLTAKVREQG